MIRICIFGSCVSRDIFGFEHEARNLECGDYYARSSFASLVGAPYVNDSLTDALDSPFQRKVIEIDMSKQFFSAFGDMRCDCLLVDVIDSRFHLLRFPGGGIATASNEFLKAAGPEHGGERIAYNSPEFLEMWRKGLREFLRLAEAYGALGKIKVSEVYWGFQSITGEPVGGNYKAPSIARMNRYLNDRYQDMRALLPPEAFINYAPELFRSDPDHKWGVAPYHFSKAFYMRTISEIERSFPHALDSVAVAS